MTSKTARAFLILSAIAGIFILVEKNQTKKTPEGRFDPLSELGIKYKTDKWHGHYYTPTYHQYFKPLRNKKLNFLEIGVGGYKVHAAGGESLRMWRDYFPHGTIVGIDIEDKTHFSDKRLHIYQGDQTDPVFLKDMDKKHGPFEIIVDDGSHRSEHIIKSFEILFPLLKDGGIYVVEDTQTSYWRRWGGSMNPNDPKTTMNYFKPLADGLNFDEIKRVDKNYLPSYTDHNILSIHFYHNLIFIIKGKNDIPSNFNRKALAAYAKRIKKK